MIKSDYMALFRELAEEAERTLRKTTDVPLSFFLKGLRDAYEKACDLILHEDNARELLDEMEDKYDD